MTASETEIMPRGVQWSLELMAMIYVATAVVFLLSPDWPILVANKAFARYEWPVIFFPTERFWLSIAVGVPGTRAFVAFSAARSPARAKFCIQILQISLLIPAAAFAWHFMFSGHVPLYAIGVAVEMVQMIFYHFLTKSLP